MLNIIYGDVKNSIYNTNVYFKNSYEPEWLDAELAKKMIKDIDDSEVLSGECINSPVLGQIPPERLSGGFLGQVVPWIFPNFTDNFSPILS